MPTPELSWRILGLLAVGGALGTISRHLVASLVPATGYPWGTLAVNVSGSLLLGVFMVGGVLKGHVSPDLRVTVGVAFFGAYTTMSTFAYETSVLAADQGSASAGLNVLLNPGLCLAGVYVGRWIGSALPAAA